MEEIFLFVCVLLTLVVSSPLPENSQEEDYRLRRTVIPRRYDLTIIPSYVENRIVGIKTYEGEVKIEAFVPSDNGPIGEIELHHAKNINIQDVSVEQDENPTKFQVENNWDEKTEKLTIKVKPNIQNNITITIKYTSEFEDGRLTGFYYSKYKYEDTKDGALLATKFEPTHARKAYPCFDEPGLKAQFDLKIKVTPLTTAIANTEKIDDEDPDWVKFKTSPIMTTYLLAFIVYETESFGHTNKSEEAAQHTTWARKEAIETNQGDLSQRDGPPMIKFMENYTNIKYDDYMDKMDQVALPDFQSGAMENWGLVTYRETSLLFDPETGTTAMHKRVSDVIAHELVHQWFGNLVVTNWWDSVWLNEGFANYFELLIMEDLYRDWRMLERFVVDEQMSVFALDATTDSVPLTKEDVLSPEDIGNHFGSISYSKGGAILRQISNVMGADNFQNACIKYLQKYAEGSATAEQLLDVFKDNNNEEISLLSKEQFKAALNSWTTQRGFPIVKVERLNTTHFLLSQKRFLQTPETIQDIDEMPLYYVPLTWTKQGEAVNEVRYPQDWLTDKQSSRIVSINGLTKDQWVLLNSWQSGYYRVNYDADSWNKINAALQTNVKVIAPVDRAAIVDNVLNLARAGEVTYKQAIDGISFLQQDTDFLPWAAARAALAHMDRMMGQDTEYKLLIQRMIEKVYNEMEWETKEMAYNYEEDNVKLTHRINVFTMACAAGHSDCLQRSEDMLRAKIDSVDKELQSVVYCYGLKNANQTLWNILWNQWEKANNNAARRGLLTTALGCANDEVILKGYLKKSLDASIVRPQDAYTVFTAVYSNPDGVQVALDFLEEEKYGKLEDAYGEVRNVMKTIISGLASRLTEEAQKTKLERAIGDKKEDHASALRTVDSNILWRKTFRAEVLNALHNEAPSTSLATCIALLCASALALLR